MKVRLIRTGVITNFSDILIVVLIFIGYRKHTMYYVPSPISLHIKYFLIFYVAYIASRKIFLIKITRSYRSQS